MRVPTLYTLGTLALFATAHAAFAQDVANGQRLSERWCTECHMIGTEPPKHNRAPPFAVIANKETVNAEMIASFLLLPHATMPNLPLSHKDAEDIAAYIIGMKK